MKEPAPSRLLVLDAALSADPLGAQCTFTFMSGQELGRHIFQDVRAEDPPLLQDLQDEARVGVRGPAVF